MVQASNEQSGKAHGEARENLGVYQGKFWCSERKDYFSWTELIEYYNNNK